MTTFILHGGYTSTPNENNRNYYSEIAKRIPKGGKILFLYFAQEESKWKNLLENDIENFKKSGVKIDFNCEIASSTPEKLIQQIKSSDCIYMRGGEDYRLIKILKDLGNFSELVKGKIVVGSSMGVWALSTYVYGNGIERGSGILPIKTFCHYDSTKAEKLEELKKYKENLPVYVLKDTEFVIINQ